MAALVRRSSHFFKLSQNLRPLTISRQFLCSGESINKTDKHFDINRTHDGEDSNVHKSEFTTISDQLKAVEPKEGSVKADNEPESFAKILRNSKFVELGDPSYRMVVGTIIEVEGDDLYIDFGGKFHCVCPMPGYKNKNLYHRGAKVRIRLIDLELSSRFMGSDTDLTLLEADAILVGLYGEKRGNADKRGYAKRMEKMENK